MVVDQVPLQVVMINMRNKTSKQTKNNNNSL